MKAARSASIIALCTALVGCGGARTFTSQQLSHILPSSANAPTGLRFISQGSGDQPINLIVKDEDQQTKLLSYGFKGAYASFYANDQAIAVLSQQTSAPDPSAHVVAMLGVVFQTAAGAHKALALDLQKDIATGRNIKRVGVGKIGEETLAEYGTQANFQFPGYLIYWRVGNALFAVLDAGGPTAGSSIESAGSFARQMQARAQKV